MKQKLVIFFACCVLGGIPCLAQVQAQKAFNEQVQAWWSINATMRITHKWGLITDFHVRRNHFLQDPSFYFLRFAANYWLTDQVTFAGGLAHMWAARPGKEGFVMANENRIYQQAQVLGKWGKLPVLNRFRNEERWSQQVINGLKTDHWEFSNRFRYLLSIGIPLSAKVNRPSLVLANEVLLQFGKEVVLNTFDQDRVFLGFRERISKDLSFDIGYMLVYQQKKSGYQYDVNHTIRWFFYYTPNWSNKLATHHPPLHETGD